MLLTAKADPNKRNNDGGSALHIAVRHAPLTSIQLLLNNKANPNLVNMNGETPLHAAINYFVKGQTVVLLLSGNANPNLKNIHDNTSLHNAIIFYTTTVYPEALLSPPPSIIKPTPLSWQHRTYPPEMVTATHFSTMGNYFTAKVFCTKNGTSVSMALHTFTGVYQISACRNCQCHRILRSISMRRRTNYLAKEIFNSCMYMHVN